MPQANEAPLADTVPDLVVLPREFVVQSYVKLSDLNSDSISIVCSQVFGGVTLTFRDELNLHPALTTLRGAFLRPLRPKLVVFDVVRQWCGVTDLHRKKMLYTGVIVQLNAPRAAP